ncbi:hypothetical protein [Streptomyces sp. NPDC001020]
MTWANGTFHDIGLALVRKAFPGVMDFDSWLDRSGRARLQTQLDSPSA